MTVVRLVAAAALLACLATTEPASSAPPAPSGRNVIIFVADSLRYGIVTSGTAPTLAYIQKNGVDFRNSHALYPTVTTANASVIATGHGIGDTGQWSNTLYTGTPFASGSGALTAGAEADPALEEMNERYGGNYLGETSLLRLARDNGYQTAAIGKEGPTLIQDIDAADGHSTIIIDDSTGAPGAKGVPLEPAVAAAITAAGLSLDSNDHKANGSMYGNSRTGLKISNIAQQTWFTDVATRVVLPRFVAAGRPFALVYWSRDPDGTQHNTGDSINDFNPGINGPTGLGGVRDASDNLQRLIDTLKALGVYDNTDIFVTADHGFSTISRQSKTSWSTHFDYPDTMFKGELPEGFVAIDMAHALGLPLNGKSGPLDPARGEHPVGTAYLGKDPAHPEAISVGSGNSELIYLDGNDAKVLARRIVGVLTGEDYTGAIFVADRLGPIPGALPMSAVGLEGGGRAPQPAIYVSFADTTTPQCLATWHAQELCSVQVSDTGLQQGQGNHGGFSRANTRNFMAAIGPDFRKRFVDLSPVSNADIAATLAKAMGLKLPAKGKLGGRVLTEALSGGDPVDAGLVIRRSAPAATGFVTVLEAQSLGSEIYLDAAGAPGRVVGLNTRQ